MKSMLFHSNQGSSKRGCQPREISMCFFALMFIVIVATQSLVSAKVIRFEIENRELVAKGQPFGRSGAYERITGKIYLEVDPRHPANQLIVDL